MTTLTLTSRDAAHSLETLDRFGVSDADLIGPWSTLVTYFAIEPAAVSVEVDAAMWSPIIAATGDAIAKAMSR